MRLFWKYSTIEPKIHRNNSYKTGLTSASELQQINCRKFSLRYLESSEHTSILQRCEMKNTGNNSNNIVIYALTNSRTSVTLWHAEKKTGKKKEKQLIWKNFATYKVNFIIWLHHFNSIHWSCDFDVELFHYVRVRSGSHSMSSCQ